MTKEIYRQRQWKELLLMFYSTEKESCSDLLKLVAKDHFMGCVAPLVTLHLPGCVAPLATLHLLLVQHAAGLSVWLAQK